MTGRCAQETHVQHAAIENRWTDSLRAHIAQCADCAAAASAAPFMAAFARADARQRPLPDPTVLWLKAQFLRGSAMAQKSSRPLNIAQMVSYVTIAAGWAALLTWKWDEVLAWFLSVTPSRIVGEMAGLQSSASAMVIAAVVVLSSLTVMLALHAILAEE